ncbi:hypothetical protein PGT21_011641 [Puccinia graminis f. sp. tritici]|uniref:Uncharacterized protein n=1 Tax=Puccinia graminis f. sp. tritici TaxID=56615 RepID=A0A5B0PRJ7_PUCGR|nr:hypothetical protein PGT21_011641 [Puccinia graminis f. sp. tritici]
MFRQRGYQNIRSPPISHSTLTSNNNSRLMIASHPAFHFLLIVVFSANFALTVWTIDHRRSFLIRRSLSAFGAVSSLFSLLQATSVCQPNRAAYCSVFHCRIPATALRIPLRSRFSGANRTAVSRPFVDRFDFDGNRVVLCELVS